MSFVKSEVENIYYKVGLKNLDKISFLKSESNRDYVRLYFSSNFIIDIPFNNQSVEDILKALKEIEENYDVISCSELISKLENINS